MWHSNRSNMIFSSVQFSSVAQLCLTLCHPINHSTPGLPVHYYLPEFTQTHVHWVDDAIQWSHPLLPSSPPAFNQGIGALALASILPMYVQGSFPLVLTGLISPELGWNEAETLEDYVGHPLNLSCQLSFTSVSLTGNGSEALLFCTLKKQSLHPLSLNCPWIHWWFPSLSFHSKPLAWFQTHRKWKWSRSVVPDSLQCHG